jgi:hypothetical protein
MELHMHDEQKEDFMRELVSFCPKNKEPYVIDWDFNILRFSYEKNKKIHPIDSLISSILLFGLMIYHNIYFSGGNYI